MTRVTFAISLSSLFAVACSSGGSNQTLNPPGQDAGMSGNPTTGTGGSGTGMGGTTGSGSGGTQVTPADGGTGTGSGGSMAGGTGGAGGTMIVKGSLTFTKKTLHMFNYAEGIGAGDFNKDGKIDVVSGPFWWEGPTFDVQHQYFPPPPNNAFGNMTLGDWADYPYDVDGDGWIDSINVMRPGTPSYWYKNPGEGMVMAPVSAWQKNAFGTLVLEHSEFVDITGEGKPALVGAISGKTGWFDVSAKVPWVFNPVGTTAATDGYAWYHGIGAGVIDGKIDMMSQSAWFSPPAGGPRAGAWTMHAQNFKGNGPSGSPEDGPAQMWAYDVDGDGDGDVVTSLQSHGYGVAWFEQTAPGVFTKHDIVGQPGAMNAGGIMSFSQPHAVYVTDVDGDGLKDIITGKSFYAHPFMTDPGGEDTPVFYVFKLVRNADKTVSWEPHLVDSVEGLGRQLTATDINGDGKVDILVACKHGAFLFFQN